jgi:hypothetical protein
MLAALFMGCKTKNNERKFHIGNIPCTSLQAEDLSFVKGDYPMLYNMVNDSLILVRNWNGKPYYLELHNIKSNTLLAKFIKRGNGPNEFLSCYVSFKSNTNQLLVFDIHKRVGATYNIDSVLKHGDFYNPCQFNIPTYLGNDIEMLNPSNILIFNKYYLTNKQFSNNVSPIYSYSFNADEQDFKAMYENTKYFTHNVTDAFIAVHPTDDLIWVIYQHENRIEIYNRKLELQKTLLGPKDFEPEYEIREDDGIEVSFKVRTRTFWYCFYNNNHIYILYIGECSGFPKEPVNLLKFTWDGTPTQRYELDRNLYTVYVDKEENYVYGTEVIQGDSPKFIKYKISE